MKKALTLLAIFLALFPELVLSQQTNVSVDLGFPRRFSVGDLYYSSSYQGIKRLMTDINNEDPKLYQVMNLSSTA